MIMREKKYARWTGLCKKNQHIWVYTGDKWTGEVCEGVKCSCGKMKAHYEICPTCKSKIRADIKI